MMRNLESRDAHFVLRTINIPKNLDDRLRSEAFRQNKSKSELIRRGIDLVLEEIDAERKPASPVRSKVVVANAATAKNASASR